MFNPPEFHNDSAFALNFFKTSSKTIAISLHDAPTALLLLK